MIRADETDPFTRARLDSARQRFRAALVREIQALDANGASDDEAAVALISGLTSAIADVLQLAVPQAQRAAHIRDISAALHVAAMKGDC